MRKCWQQHVNLLLIMWMYFSPRGDQTSEWWLKEPKGLIALQGVLYYVQLNLNCIVLWSVRRCVSRMVFLKKNPSSRDIYHSAIWGWKYMQKKHKTCENKSYITVCIVFLAHLQRLINIDRDTIVVKIIVLNTSTVVCACVVTWPTNFASAIWRMVYVNNYEGMKRQPFILHRPSWGVD